MDPSPRGQDGARPGPPNADRASQCFQQAGHPSQLSLSYNYSHYISPPPPSSLAAPAPTTPNPNFLLLSASSQAQRFAASSLPVRGPGKGPRGHRDQPCPTLPPPPCGLSLPSQSPATTLLPKAARAPGEALPGGASRGLICCHLISICCTWELSLGRERPGEAAGMGEMMQSFEESPVQFLPGLAGPLQASALTVPRPGACLCQFLGLGEHGSMKHCVYGGC